MSVVVVGLSHRSIGLDVLEATAVPAEARPKALHDLRQREHLGEVAVLSTCMRTEVYATTSRFHGAAGDIRNFLAAWSGLPPEAMACGLYDYFADRAVQHLLTVAAGLDSALIGESDILRQVRDAGDAARAEGTAGVVLGPVFRRAIETGKRVRSETAISRGTTSLSHTAVMLAGEAIAASPEPAGAGAPCPGAAAMTGRRALVVGAGEMGKAVASLFASGPGTAGVLVANRTPQRAAALASHVGGRSVPWDGLAAAVAGVDVVFCATSSPAPVLDAATVGPRPAGRPLVVVDLGLPRDVDPSVGALPGVTLFGIEDLRARAEAAIAGRRAEIPKAQAIVATEVARWAGASAEREVTPLVRALRDRAEAIRAGELARVERRLDLSPAERRAVEAMTRAIVAKLLHEPTVNLKAAAGEEGGDRLANALAELFDL